MDAAVFFESEYRPLAPLVQAKRKIDDTAVSSESEYSALAPLVQAKRKIDDTAVFPESEIDVKEVKVVPVSSEHEYPALDLKWLYEGPEWQLFLHDLRFHLYDCSHHHQNIGSDYRPTDLTVGGGFYVPIFMKSFVEEMTSDSGPYNEKTNSVVVTNLPLRTCDSELFELFRPFGATLAHAASTKDVEFYGCFGFVNFATREQAQKAVDNGGFVYRNHPLGVEWVTPKTT